MGSMREALAARQRGAVRPRRRCLLGVRRESGL